VSGRRRRGAGPGIKIIKWRDIPAQVNGTAGDQKVQVELPPRFQKAIDRAAMVGDVKDANSYIMQMGQEARPLDGDDVEAAVAAVVAEIEGEFTLERLNQFVATGGWHPEADHQPLDAATIAAAELGDDLTIDPPNQP